MINNERWGRNPDIRAEPEIDEAAIPERRRAGMIQLTRLDGSHIYVNSDLIEFVETTPDTVVSLTTGRKLVVRESAEAISSAILLHKRAIRSLTRIASRAAS